MSICIELLLQDVKIKPQTYLDSFVWYLPSRIRSCLAQGFPGLPGHYTSMMGMMLCFTIPDRFPLSPALCPVVGDQGFHNPFVARDRRKRGLTWTFLGGRMRHINPGKLFKLSVTYFTYGLLIISTHFKSSPIKGISTYINYIPDVHISKYNLLHYFALCFNYFWFIKQLHYIINTYQHIYP